MQRRFVKSGNKVIANQDTAFLPAMSVALCQLRAQIQCTLTRRAIVQTMGHLPQDSISSRSSGRDPCLYHRTATFLFPHTTRTCEDSAPEHLPVSDSTGDANYSTNDAIDKLDNVMQHTYDRLCATKTKPRKKTGPARQGSKRMKAMERLANAEGVLDLSEATGYRARSARGNYLSRDRADISYATKELCRDFSQPNHKSYNKLKRVGRFLVGRPRLLYHYKSNDKGGDTDTIEVYSDTDFAG